MNIFFRNKYLHQSVMLEAVAVVPGMVSALIYHIKSLQGMHHDGGWIGNLLHNPENGQMHLITPCTAHCIVEYHEEDAVTSYAHFIKEVDAGRIKNFKAPDIAIAYWNLDETVTLRDVVLAVLAGEALHRDTNHHFSNRIRAGRESLFEDLGHTENKSRIKY
ncbi:inducible alternative oxidase 2 [Coemansia sp. RSA 1646]|nr:inducible alternative oxidase 2 [Coemansia sp. RSA 1646]